MEYLIGGIALGVIVAGPIGYWLGKRVPFLLDYFRQ